MRLKIKILSMILVVSLLLSGNCMELDAATVTLHSEKNTAFIKKDIPEESNWEDLRLHKDVHDDVDYSRFIEGPEQAPVIEVKEPPKDIYMGEFRVTYYCGCYSCSEEYGTKTATGTRAVEGRTIAVDPRVISYGSKVLINGHEYVAEDCGGAIKGNDIDIYLEDHDRVYKSGVDYYDVYIVRD
jgi:3D (Asp-Asp-Asp) domain-containing protein